MRRKGSIFRLKNIIFRDWSNGYDERFLLCKLGTLRCVEAVNEMSSGSATRICQFEVHDHNLSKGNNREKTKKADNKEKSNHPTQMRILYVHRGIGFSGLFCNNITHPKQITTKPTCSNTNTLIKSTKQEASQATLTGSSSHHIYTSSRVLKYIKRVTKWVSY